MDTVELAFTKPVGQAFSLSYRRLSACATSHAVSTWIPRLLTCTAYVCMAEALGPAKSSKFCGGL